MIELINQLLKQTSDGRILDIRIGMHWTAVVMEMDGVIHCGLASTVYPINDLHQDGPDIPLAGKLFSISGRTLAEYALSENTLLSSLGIAALNALLPLPSMQDCRTINAEHIILEYGRGRNVAIIGRFPFVKRVRDEVKNLYLIELDPQPGEYGPQEAPHVLPLADVVAITGMTLINKTFGDVIRYCPPDAIKLMLGPTTPLSWVLFNHGLDLLSGSIVENVQNVLLAVSQGASFRQIHQSGVRLITLAGPRILEKLN